MPVPAGSGSPTTAVDFTELKQHLNFKNDNNDPELMRFLLVAESAVGLLVGPLIPTERTDKLDGGRQCLILKSPRAVSLTGATYRDGGSIDPSTLDLDPDSGVVYVLNGCLTSGFRNVLVTYLAGWAVVPREVLHAVKELVRHLWETQRPNNYGTRNASVDDDGAALAGAFTSWPSRVQEFLQPYIALHVA